MTCDRAGNANPFLETSVYTLSTSLVLGDFLLLVLFLGDLSVLYVAIGADSEDQIKTLPVCTYVHCKCTRRSIKTVAAVMFYYFRICLSMSDLTVTFRGSSLLEDKIDKIHVQTSTAREKGNV
jgi:hypothetical protein